MAQLFRVIAARAAAAAAAATEGLRFSAPTVSSYTTRELQLQESEAPFRPSLARTQACACTHAYTQRQQQGDIETETGEETGAEHRDCGGPGWRGREEEREQEIKYLRERDRQTPKKRQQYGLRETREDRRSRREKRLERDRKTEGTGIKTG